VRGLHVPILADLARGTSRSSETDVYDATAGRWQICYDYRYPEELFSINRHYCTWADAPVPPTAPTWHQFSGCPGVYYPNVISVQVSNANPFGCTCLTLTTLNLTWNIAIGAFGGWRGVTSTCLAPGLTFTVQPQSFAMGGIFWLCTVSWPGGSNSQLLFAPCGHRFGVIGWPINAPPICTGANLTALYYWDWAI